MRIKPLTRLAPLVLALAFATPAFAAQPSQAQIDAMLEAMDAKAMVQQMMPTLMQQAQAMAENALPGEATAESRASFNRIMQKQQASMSRLLAWETLHPLYSRLYSQVFTAAEVEATTRFYQSPEGRSSMAKMPQLMQLTMQELQPLLIQVMAETEAAIDAEVQALEAGN